MSTNFHTPFVDLVSKFRPTHMNKPLGELDAQITTNVAAIAANTARIGALTAGKFALGNSAGDGLKFREIITSGGVVMVSAGNVIVG